MATALLAVIVSIVLSHSLPELGRLRHYGWFEGWLRGDLNPFVATAWWQGRFGGLCSVGLPVLVIAIPQFLFHGLGYGLPSFLLATVVLFYCWGPRDLDEDARRASRAETADDRTEALRSLGDREDFPSKCEAGICGRCEVIVNGTVTRVCSVSARRLDQMAVRRPWMEGRS